MAFRKKGRTPDAANLAAEFVKIGSTPKIKGGRGGEPYFWRPQSEGVGPNNVWDARTRQVGEEFYSLGDRSLDLMHQALEHVVTALGPMVGVGLNVGGQPCPG